MQSIEFQSSFTKVVYMGSVMIIGDPTGWVWATGNFASYLKNWKDCIKNLFLQNFRPSMYHNMTLKNTYLMSQCPAYLVYNIHNCSGLETRIFLSYLYERFLGYLSSLFRCLSSFMFTFVVFSHQLNTSFSALTEYRH